MQYCAAKSLPFTAATMTLNCVSAALSTLIPKEFSSKLISDLMSKGYKSEAQQIRKINYVVKNVISSDPTKRKSKKTNTERTKRSRFQLHRTTVSKRVTTLAQTILLQKAEYLSSCEYVGIILDEGNNVGGSCPLYVSTISCDAEFNWRVMFIGQAETEGGKTGGSIWQLVKQIFVNVSMEHIYRKIVSVGTDGASVMRSSPKYRGEFVILRYITMRYFSFILIYTCCRSRLSWYDWHIVQCLFKEGPG